MRKNKFNKTPIAASLSLILGSVVFNPLYAEESETNTEDDNIVTITGMRGSLQSSMNTKRDSTGIIDAITAEDIGKFPDTNLAESLQRITGVSISRANGEGSKVTVRGFGPQYNMITMNGRTMPAAEIATWGGDSDTRAFSFENLSSDGVQSVEVYKTGKANIASGGIGATININTAKPFSNPGFVASAGVSANHDTTVHDGSSITPELSGIISWTNDDETFGISLNASSSDRESGTVGAEVAQWRSDLWSGSVGSTLAAIPPEFTNEPAIGATYALPSNLLYSMSDVERERTNAQLTLQFRPKSNITTTLDYTYSNLKSDENRSEMSIWMENYISALTFDNGISHTPVIYREERFRHLTNTEGGLDPRDQAFGQININSQTDNKSLGFAVNWDVSDDLVIKFDAHQSSAEATPMQAFGNRLVTGIGANVLNGQGANYNSSLPLIITNFDDCNAARGLNCNNTLDVADLGTSIMQRAYATNKSEVDQYRVDGSYAFEEFSIDFGIESRAMSNQSTTANENFTMGNWGVDNPGELPDGFLNPIDFANLFNDYDTTGGWTEGFRGNAAQLGAWAADKYGFDMDSVMSQGLNRTIEEDIKSVYLQVNTDGEVSDMLYNLTIGVRYEDTDSKSIADVAPPAHILWESNDDFNVISGSGTIPYAVSNTYSHVLPNLDFDIEFSEDLIGRFSYSKTIARTQYSHLSSAANITGGPSLPTILGNAQPGSASSGNPALVPLESENIDLSLEWYFDETSYASVGYYTKDVTNFVGRAPVISDFYNLRDASNGPRAQAALDALNAQNIVVNPTTLFSMMAAIQLGVDFDSMTAEQFEAAADIVPDAQDALMPFQYQAPVNNKTATIDGWELAVQHFFAETGFGVQFNYTTVNGDIGFDLAASPDVTQFALFGLSDTANAILMYEKDDLNVRLTYNWRDSFLNDAARYNSEPEFVEEYSQIDLSVGYQFSDNLTVSFDAINLTEENSRTHGRTVNQLWNLNQYGARYSLGARYTY